MHVLLKIFWTGVVFYFLTAPAALWSIGRKRWDRWATGAHVGAAMIAAVAIAAWLLTKVWSA